MFVTLPQPGLRHDTSTRPVGAEQVGLGQHQFDGGILHVRRVSSMTDASRRTPQNPPLRRLSLRSKAPPGNLRVGKRLEYPLAGTLTTYLGFPKTSLCFALLLTAVSIPIWMHHRRNAAPPDNPPK